MTSGGNNFNDFPENQLTKFRAFQTVLRQIGSTRSFVQRKVFRFEKILSMIKGLGVLSPQASRNYAYGNII